MADLESCIIATMLPLALNARSCPHCRFWTQGRPYLRRHIRDEHPTLPQYRRRPKPGHYRAPTEGEKDG